MSTCRSATTATTTPSHGGIGKYLVVFVALCVLTMCSFLTYFDFWREHVPTQASRALMMAVSCTKAMLVIMFFMHLLWEANWKWVLTIPATFMSIFLMLMLVPDVGRRQNNGYAHYSRGAAAVRGRSADDRSRGNESSRSRNSRMRGLTSRRILYVYFACR